MKLYYQPGTCAIGIHVLLEEIGKPYDLKKLDLQKGEHREPGFTRINPKSKVPTLERDDGSVLTEFPAIAIWLARTNPDKALLPSDAEGEARALEAMDYVVATLHGQGFARMFRPMVFAPSEADHDKVKARGREIFEKGLSLMSQALAGKDYITGRFSVADTALFYVEFWAHAILRMPLPENCAAHYERMKSRPAVRRVLEQQGFAAVA
jgi:glutathione S-transferase